jgi:MFS family permease
VTAAGAFGVLEFAAAVMPGFLMTALLLVPTGMLMLTFTTAANSSVQLGVEPTMRGRVMALYLICFMGGTPLGAPMIGWVAEVLGPRWGMLGGGIICVISALGIGAVLARRRGLDTGYLSDRLAAAVHHGPPE